jgi:MFS family permease
MEINQLFYSWVPKYLRYAILLLMLFVVLCANGVYLGITTDMYSDLGVYSEPYTMATNAMYIGMAAGMIFIIRLAVRFSEKFALISGLVIMLLMNLICATTNSPALTVAASLVLGFGKIFALVVVYVAWLAIWSKQMNSARVYPLLYFMALAGLYFLTWLTSRFAWLFSWRYAYPFVLVLLIICILLAVLFVERHEVKRRIPLYQLDIPGLALFILSLMLINYVAVYGRVEDWFESQTIRAASFGSIITALLFIKRELGVKRPFLDLKLFRIPNFRIALFLFILLGALTPTTFQSAFSGTVLHYESFRNSEINLYLIPGVFVGSVLSYFWFKYNYNTQLLIVIGFAAFAVYHILMYTRFVNDLNINAFWIPSFFKGFGTAVLFIAIGLYAAVNVPFLSLTKVVGVVIMVRSFLAPGIFSGLYNYILYAERNRHLSILAGDIDANDPVFQQMDRAGYYSVIQQQAHLSALKEISGNIIIFGLTVIILLSVVWVYGKLRKRLIPA